MRRAPITLARPLVILSGYHTWSPVAWALADRLRELTGAKNIVCVSFLFETSLHAARAHAHKVILHHLGNRANTIDAVGISMGGIIARMLHAGVGTQARDQHDAIQIARLFTLASPHRGAIRAERVRVDQASRELRAGSDVLRTLDAARAEGRDVTELHCYAQLRDRVVGASRCAPEHHPLFWTGATRLASHFTTSHNPWFLCDIARRLRGEEPLFNRSHPPLPSCEASPVPTR